MQLLQALHMALDKGQLSLCYQPQLAVEDERVVGFEALLRWQHPTLGFISPAEFIPVAEDSGLIVPIGNWVLEQACLQMKDWLDAGLGPMRIAVNLSSRQFEDDELPSIVSDTLARTRLPPAALELEITESIAMEDIDRALRMIEPLRARGVRFSIDDFGTGHSSLSALTRLPFEVLKIDQSFVRGLSQNTHSAAIIETILALAVALDYEVVAEGVETEAEAEFLRRRGCPIAQGFLYSAAQPPEVYLGLLREGAIKPNKDEAAKVDQAVSRSALDPAA
jgi:EAL domain-containing protein (putative c-di-GMP-specific phosphodiesterase class I)